MQYGSSGDRADLTALALLVVLVGLLAALIVLPYLQYVLIAIVLGYVLYPVQTRLAPRVGPSLAAGTLVVLTVAVILVPAAIVLGVAIRQGSALVTAVREGDVGPADVDAWLRTVGLDVELGVLYETFRAPITTGVRGLAGNVVGIVGGLPEVLIGLTILLFLLYYLLRDGDRFVRWIKSVTPVRADLQDELIDRMDRIMWATIVGTVVVAGLQALLTAIGLLLVGVPGVVFLGVLTFVLGLLPLIGASVVWAPISVYLLVVGRPIAGVFLFVYGTIVVSLSDNYVRPITVGRGADLSVASVIVGIFGGVAIFGFVGVFFGPVVLGLFKTVVELYARERAESSTIPSGGG